LKLQRSNAIPHFASPRSSRPKKPVTITLAMLRSLSRVQRFSARRLGFQARREVASYTEQYRRSLAQPEAFWAEAAQDIEWFKPWSKVLDTYVTAPYGRVQRLLTDLALSVAAARGARRPAGSWAAR
jgi:hypothetical protein